MASPMQELPRIESARGRIPLVTAEVIVGEHRFELLHPRSVDELITDEDFERLAVVLPEVMA